MSIKVLYVGDTQVNVQTPIKGIDSWTFAYYSDSARYLRNALRAADDIILDHIPSMNCIADMPSTVEEMKQYDAILVSDVGYNNIVFQPGNVQPFKVPMGPDRVKALCEYVNQGGGFMMIGGWLSFSGMQGKGMYGGTKVEELLPVTCMPRGADDRMEITEGYAMQLDDPNHPIVKDIDWSVPYMLMGYNKVYLREDAPGRVLQRRRADRNSSGWQGTFLRLYLRRWPPLGGQFPGASGVCTFLAADHPLGCRRDLSWYSVQTNSKRKTGTVRAVPV